MEEPHSRCGPGSLVALFVDEFGSPARDAYADDKPNPPAASAYFRDCRSSPNLRQIPPVSEFVDASERPSPPVAIQDYQRLPVSHQIPLASEIVDVGERPSPPVASASVQDRQILPASELVFAGERPSSPAVSGRCSDGGENH